MKTYTFIVNNEFPIHVDLNNQYGYTEARVLLLSAYPEHSAEFVPIVMLNRHKNNPYAYAHEIRRSFVPFGCVSRVKIEELKQYGVDNWQEYLNISTKDR